MDVDAAAAVGQGDILFVRACALRDIRDDTSGILGISLNVTSHMEVVDVAAVTYISKEGAIHSDGLAAAVEVTHETGIGSTCCNAHRLLWCADVSCHLDILAFVCAAGCVDVLREMIPIVKRADEIWILLCAFALENVSHNK